MKQKWVSTKFINQSDLVDKTGRMSIDEVVFNSKHELVEIETSF